ncbi:MAG TPA: acetate/propionate family kinase, partial [Myxococcota bacterium]|nr:acetate/propionate family kinase [Myxococcota bacterium]
MIVLTVNSGSSSVKLDVFDGDPAGCHRRSGRRLEGTADTGALAEVLRESGPVDAVAHRVVHGGPRFAATVRVDAEVQAAIGALREIAPLHNGLAHEWIVAARAATGPSTAHFAVFDTAFFAGLPEPSRAYALPRAVVERFGLRRYGFHGLAHDGMWRRLCALRPQFAPAGRAITFQLGAGCSAAAIVGGSPVETSMGFTPLEGLVMATRSGSFDPGILTFLLRGGMTAEELDVMLTRESGLLGMAGDGDMRRVMARRDAPARLAIDVYCRAARHQLGAYLAALGGAHAVAFGGGVGE